MTMHQEEEYLNKASEIGVEGYVIKMEIDNLSFVIKTVLEGKKYLTQLSID